MAHADHCNTTPSYYDSSHTNSCYNFNNYADAHTNGCGHNNANPILCPGVFQGDFHINNSCHADTSHTNVAYNHTAFSNNYYHTPYSHTPHTNTPHTNIPYSHTPHQHVTSHAHGCTEWVNLAPGGHNDYGDSAGHCNWLNAEPKQFSNYSGHSHFMEGSHKHTAFSDIPYSHIPYSHTAHKNVAFSNSYSHAPHKNTPFSNSYSHTPHKNVPYSHTPFVNFCNHTDHNAG